MGTKHSKGDETHHHDNTSGVKNGGGPENPAPIETRQYPGEECLYRFVNFSTKQTSQNGFTVASGVTNASGVSGVTDVSNGTDVSGVTNASGVSGFTSVSGATNASCVSGDFGSISAIDQNDYMPRLVELYTEGFRLLSFVVKPGHLRMGPVFHQAESLIKCQAIFRKSREEEIYDKYTIKNVRSVLPSRLFQSGAGFAIGQGIVGTDADIDHVFKTIGEETNGGARLVCIEVTGVNPMSSLAHSINATNLQLHRHHGYGRPNMMLSGGHGNLHMMSPASPGGRFILIHMLILYTRTS